MLDEIFLNPSLGKYRVNFRKSDTLFLEGDASRDLYILVSGRLDIVKGNKKIAEIEEKGAVFGEIASLLEGKRTATVKARSEVSALRIPGEELSVFLGRYPEVAREMTRHLAKRLHDASTIVQGLKNFCDQLPDAVILADKEGKVLSWNSAAENLYGRDWNYSRSQFVEEMYEEPEEYRSFLQEVQEKFSVREKVLRVKHPERGTRYVSTSTTLLYDGHHNFTGFLSLGRDVTAVKRLGRRAGRFRLLLTGLFLVMMLFILADLGGYFPFPPKRLSVGGIDLDMRNRLAKDYLFLKALLLDYFERRDKMRTGEIMRDFCRIQEPGVSPYTGLILLDRYKKVFNAYSVNQYQHPRNLAGSSYAGIEFQGGKESLHKVLVLYRADREHPMGERSVEVAFEMTKGERFLGWLVFQLDRGLLEKKYKISEADLKKYDFPRN